jgi:5-methylcytosine-specific restriction endonuclease McrA
MKIKRSTIVNNLDTVFSQYIRRKDAIDEIAECVTCGKKDHYKKLQCGHFMSRRHYSTRWDENNVAVQCYGCNITNQGQQFLFAKHLGLEKAEEMVLKSKQIVKFSDNDLQDMIQHYKNKLKEFS